MIMVLLSLFVYFLIGVSVACLWVRHVGMEMTPEGFIVIAVIWPGAALLFVIVMAFELMPLLFGWMIPVVRWMIKHQQKK